MILLDIDHVSTLKYENHPRTRQVSDLLEGAEAQDAVGTTIITIEEQLSGWLGRIRRERNPHRQVNHYQQLGD